MGEEAAVPGSEGSSEQESARWFLLSVLRHARSATWTDPQQSGVEEPEQKRLAEVFLRSRSARQSLNLVLRSEEVQNRLVRFGSSRDIAQQQLVDTTKAYRHALAVLHQSGHLSLPSSATSGHESPITGTTALSVAQRRAARRGLDGKTVTAGDEQSNSVQQGNAVGADLSDEEFDVLQDLLTERQPAAKKQRAAVLRSTRDRFSLLWGILAGVVFFVVVNWLFF